MDKKVNYKEHHYNSHDGLSLYYREYGSGERTIVCIPGLTRNSKDFHRLATQLSSEEGGGWRVLCPDLRGRGQSEYDPNWEQYLPPTYVQDMWALLDDLSLRKVVIIGTSLGGLMAMIMADQQPERLQAVVLNDIGPEITPSSTKRIQSYVGRTPPQDSLEAVTVQVKAAYELAFPNQSDEFWQDIVESTWRKREDGRFEPDFDPAIGDALRKAVKSMGMVKWLRRFGIKRMKGLNLDPWDNFRAMTMPVLLLRGELSDVLSPEITQRMKQEKPDLVVVEVPERGHAPTLNENVARKALAGFLRRPRS